MDYLRLPIITPNTVPPNGFVDIVFNHDTNTFSVRRSDGSLTGLDTVTQAEVIAALGFTPANAAKFAAGAGALTGPAAPLTVKTAAGKDVGTGAGQVPVTGDYMPADGAPYTTGLTAVTGNPALDRANGRVQMVTLTGATEARVIPAPSNGTIGKEFVLFLHSTTNNARTLAFDGAIVQPADSTQVWPKALTQGVTYLIKMVHIGTAWKLVSLVG